MVTEAYHDCIRAVFIEPIRSVLIVDDDYPTWGQLLAPLPQVSLTGSETATQRRLFERIRELIAAFHARRPPLLVDIHDGTDVATATPDAAPSRLHQTDLLVLDYELVPGRRGDGSRAIEILRSLMSNSHFNLVVLHTKENLDGVFDDVRWALLTRSTSSLSTEETERAQHLLSDADDNAPGFGRRLSDTVASGQYFYYRLCPDMYSGAVAQGSPPYGEFANACHPDWRTVDRLLVLRYLLMRLEGRNATRMRADSPTDDVRWSTGACRWIWSNSVFVAFWDKEGTPDLMDALQHALVDWCPHPSRLLLAKLRVAVENYGILAQNPTLAKRHALAYWYRDLLRADYPERHWRVRQTAFRHAAELVESVLDDVAEFASRFVDADVGTDEPEDICRRHFGIDLSNAATSRIARRQHNMLVCSMRPVGWHLTLGHVFQMDGDHWLCVSAACDLVPSQLSPWRTSLSGDALPFLAVRLAPIRANRNIRDVQTNRYVFLPHHDDVAVFSFSDEVVASPQWHLMYAANTGRFSDEQFHFDVSRAEVDVGTLVLQSRTAQVVAQLRYEYALNFAHRLGAVLTRVGLDFVAD